ncbi:hypothetical protein K8I61_13825 [bacterium]|nr:hypothetical protein [bacterium]
MNRIPRVSSVVFVTIVALVLGASLAFAGGTLSKNTNKAKSKTGTQNVRLSDLDKSLKSYEGGTFDVTKKKSFTYKATGDAAFDSIQKSATKAQLGVAFAKKIAGSKKATTSDLKAARKVLPKKKDFTQLQGDIQTFVGSIQGDFTKITMLTDANDVLKKLNKAGKQAQKIAKKIAKRLN